MPNQLAPAPHSSQHGTTSPEAAEHAAPRARLTAAERRVAAINFATVVIPFIGLAAAIVLLWGIAFDWTYLLILAGMYLVTAVGITVGYHRLFTHASFETPAVIRYLLAAAGSMAVQGPVIHWCAEHRRHHQHSDTQEDPHSPHMASHGSWGEGLFATLRGAFHSHVGWLFAKPSENLDKYTRDLRRDPAVVLADREFIVWVVMGLVIPAVVGGLITMSATGMLLGFLWGGLVRVLLVHHVTWSVNSICHLWGTRPFESHDESRNNPIVGFLAFGEGWHNNHHAFPTSARHGLRWWEFDLAYVMVRAMQTVGLARRVRVPDKVRLAEKRRTPRRAD